jgi:hypothetical protein
MHLSERLAALDGPTNGHRRGTRPCFLCQPPQRVRGNVVEKKHPNVCVRHAGAGWRWRREKFRTGNQIFGNAQEGHKKRQNKYERMLPHRCRIFSHRSHVWGSSLYSELNAPKIRSLDVKLCSRRRGLGTGRPAVALVIALCMCCGSISGRDCLKSETR